jgi:hypothetical protein
MEDKPASALPLGALMAKHINQILGGIIQWGWPAASTTAGVQATANTHVCTQGQLCILKKTQILVIANC